MVTGIFHTIRDKGFGLITRQTTGARAQGAPGTPPSATGIITTIWDKGYGFIGRDTRSERVDLYFHRTAVEADGFDGLREGQRVGFDEEPNPRDRNHQRAVNVRPADGGDA